MPMAAFHRCYWDNRYCNSALRSGRLRLRCFFVVFVRASGDEEAGPICRCTLNAFNSHWLIVTKQKNLSEYYLREMSLELSSRLRSRFKGYPYKTAFAA